MGKAVVFELRCSQKTLEVTREGILLAKSGPVWQRFFSHVSFDSAIYKGRLLIALRESVVVNLA